MQALFDNGDIQHGQKTKAGLEQIPWQKQRQHNKNELARTKRGARVDGETSGEAAVQLIGFDDKSG